MKALRHQALATLCAAALLAAASNLLLRHAMSGLMSETDGEGLLLRALGAPLVLLGLGGYASSHLLWLNVLSQSRLGAAFPVFVAAMFVMVLAGAALILGEPLTLPRLLGALLVAAGIVVAEWPRKKQREPEGSS